MSECNHNSSAIEGGLVADLSSAKSSRWLAFVAAVQFLTRIPLLTKTLPPADVLARSPVFFPLVGALIGVFTTAATSLGALVWPPWLAVLVALGFEALLTGGFHEDAVADFCDAFGGGRTRDQTLAIFKDSRIGAFGALGLLVLFSLRAGAIMTLIGQWGVVGWPIWGSALVASSALGRYVMVLAMALLPPAAGRESLARAVGSTLSRWDWAASSVWVALTTAPFVILLPVQFLVAVLMLLASALGLLLVVHRRLGGITGDCLGCLGYIGQVAVLLAAAARKQPWTPLF
ncbi:MAG: adenosylcobinamide-GDP ribazoletransferase [Isosphaeraceae bacterium]